MPQAGDLLLLRMARRKGRQGRVLLRSPHLDGGKGRVHLLHADEPVFHRLLGCLAQQPRLLQGQLGRNGACLHHRVCHRNRGLRGRHQAHVGADPRRRAGRLLVARCLQSPPARYLLLPRLWLQPQPSGARPLPRPAVHHRVRGLGGLLRAAANGGKLCLQRFGLRRRLQSHHHALFRWLLHIHHVVLLSSMRRRHSGRPSPSWDHAAPAHPHSSPGALPVSASRADAGLPPGAGCPPDGPERHGNGCAAPAAWRSATAAAAAAAGRERAARILL
mmetsp:Transcript_20456/g.51661  ORF Transcript_20456/g.51661 Transcript_20456/m.51661 type:complete len:275 (+) Transcript_20456:295-1119(+)